MVDAGFENQKELTTMQLDNHKEIAEIKNETQIEIAGIQSVTSRQNTKDQVYAQNEMLAYQQKESTARVASIMENTNLSKHQFFFSSRRRHTRSLCDWSSDVCSSDLSCSRRARPLSTPSALPPGGSTATSSCSRAKAAPGASSKAIPRSGNAYPPAPIHCCSCDPDRKSVV